MVVVHMMKHPEGGRIVRWILIHLSVVVFVFTLAAMTLNFISAQTVGEKIEQLKADIRSNMNEIDAIKRARDKENIDKRVLALEIDKQYRDENRLLLYGLSGSVLALLGEMFWRLISVKRERRRNNSQARPPSA
jgi:hypothetical protein